MSAKTSQEIARASAAKALMAVARHYAAAGIPAIHAPIPAEIEDDAAILRSLNGLDAFKLVVERQCWLPFSDR